MNKKLFVERFNRRDVLRLTGLAGVVGFSGFTGLKFGSEPAIASPTGTPSIADGIRTGTHPVSPYDIQYQNIDTSRPIKITYTFTDSTGAESTNIHLVNLSGNPESGTVSTGNHSIRVPPGNVQLGIEISHPSLSNTLSTSPSPVTTILANASIVDDGTTVLEDFDGENFAGSNTVSSYDIEYNGLDTNNQISIKYIFTDSDGSESTDTHTLDISSKPDSDTVSTGIHSISVPQGTLELDIELLHSSLESPIVTTVGSIGEVYPDVVDATGGTTVIDRTIGGQAYRIHAFENTGNDTFFVNRVPPAASVDVLIVGGGGGGGGSPHGAGGGAGGVLEQQNHSISEGSHEVHVGSGGDGSPGSAGDNYKRTGDWPDHGKSGENGRNSTFSGLTALGGGGGGMYNEGGGSNDVDGKNGGSGGGGTDEGSGGSGLQSSSADGGFGSDAPRAAINDFSAGGGGAGERGSEDGKGHGGDGLYFGDKFGTFFGENGYFAGGGGGAVYSNGSSGNGNSTPGGNGGGGNGGVEVGFGSFGPFGEDGMANTGGGGGGSERDDGASPSKRIDGGDGGSGIVLIRYEI